MARSASEATPAGFADEIGQGLRIRTRALELKQKAARTNAPPDTQVARPARENRLTIVK